MASRIVVQGVDAGYGAVRVLHGVSLEVREGETVALLGTNGNGKSTLIKCIMGMVTPQAGEIYLETDGQRIDLTRKSTEEIVGMGIALVPEGRRLFPKLTVEENLLLGAYRREARTGIARNLAFCFEAFPVLHGRRRQLAGSMSGGEQQMLAIGRALMSRPKLLLLDEPSMGLGPLIVEQILEVLGRLKADGLTMVLVEQNPDVALRLADRCCVLESGHLVASGTPEFLRSADQVRNLYLGGP